MATFDKSKRPKRYSGGTIRRTSSGGYVGEIYQDGRLHRSPTLPDEMPAKAWIDGRVKARSQHGALVSKLTGRQVMDALDAIARLEKDGVKGSLLDAAEFYAKHHKAAAESWTVAHCLDLYLRDMEHPQDGSSPARPASRNTKRKRLKTLIGQYGTTKVAEITPDEVLTWLASTKATGRYLLNLRSEVQSLFNFAEKRMQGGYVNQVARFPTVRKKEIAPAEIVEPRHVRAVLHWLEARRPRVALGVAVSCFAGLRTYEIIGGKGLQWSDIDFKEKRIVVPASLSKTRDRREVRIPDNLMAWLVRYRADKGRVAVASGKFRDFRNAAYKAVSANWPKNGARHSFGTYWAKLHGYRDTADQLGHKGNINMLVAHYSGTCTTEQAEEYFSIIPAVTGKAIKMTPAQA